MSTVHTPQGGAPRASSQANANDLGIREFAFYDLIIDARSPREYGVDHIPRAENLPVVNDEEFAEVGTMHRKDKFQAYLIGVTHSLRNMATWIEEIGSRCDRSSRILVYCFRGGKRSKLWSDNLRTIGFNVEILPGGWKAYRRWVLASLEIVTREFDFIVISGHTGSGKTRLLKALSEEGAQTLDLEGLARHRGSLIGAIPGVAQPTQKTFDSLLLERLRSFDTSKPVFIESESKKVGNIQLPTALMTAMHHAAVLRIRVPLEERLRVWREDFPHFVTNPELLLSRIEHLRELLGAKVLKEWESLASEGKIETVFEQLMLLHYDPAYKKSTPRMFKNWEMHDPIEIQSAEHQALRGTAKQVIASLAWIFAPEKRPPVSSATLH